MTMQMSKRKLLKNSILGLAVFIAACKTKLLDQKSLTNQPTKNGANMPFSLPELPYAKNALAPHISENTMNFHYGKHHQAYVTNLNNLVAGSDLAKKSLEEIIKISANDKTKIGILKYLK